MWKHPMFYLGDACDIPLITCDGICDLRTRQRKIRGRIIDLSSLLLSFNTSNLQNVLLAKCPVIGRIRSLVWVIPLDILQKRQNTERLEGD